MSAYAEGSGGALVAPPRQGLASRRKCPRCGSAVTKSGPGWHCPDPDCNWSLFQGGDVDSHSLKDLRLRYRDKGIFASIETAAAYLADKWSLLEERYGRRTALAMAVAMVATGPLPGSIPAIVAAAEAIRGMHGYFGWPKSFQSSFTKAWITIGGHACEGGEGEHCGGTKVEIEGGVIRKGPKKLVGKKPGQDRKFKPERELPKPPKVGEAKPKETKQSLGETYGVSPKGSKLSHYTSDILNKVEVELKKEGTTGQEISKILLQIYEQAVSEWKEVNKKKPEPAKEPEKPAEEEVISSGYEIPKDLDKAASRYLAKLPEDQLDAVKNYTGSYSIHINRQMRKCPETFDCMEKEFRVMAEKIETAIANAPELPEPVKLYRGINLSKMGYDADKFVAALENAYKEGKDIRFPSITSTTFSPGTGLGFTGGKGVVFQITTRKGLYVKPISSYASEEEVVQSSKTSYRIAKIADMHYGSKALSKVKTIYLEPIE